ncbi:MAG: hypothetical protein ABI690_18410 [Chloroflexota bacterium]
MPEPNLSSVKSRSEKVSPELLAQREKVMGNVLEQLKPWLLEFGNWIFGGLLAFTLVIVATLLNVGPNHLAIRVSIAIFACSLPLNVSGLFSLKLIRDMNKVAIDEVMKQAFQDAGSASLEITGTTTQEQTAPDKRRTDVGLRYATRIAALGALLTLLGMAAALWYMAWWIAVIFAVMVIVSIVITMNIISGLIRPQTDGVKIKV